MKRILVLNPNSSVHITKSMQGAVDLLGIASVADVSCQTLQDGPPGIESQAHVDGLALPVAQYFYEHEADAYIIGCFSDPGLFASREKIVGRPVLGIAESALQLSTTLGAKFGVIAMGDGAIKRHMRIFKQMELMHRFGGDRGLNMKVTELQNSDQAIGRIIEVGSKLRDLDRADVLILGCAGMGLYRAEVERALGLPVIDPTQAAVARAITMLSLGYSNTA